MFDFIDFRRRTKKGYHNNVIPCTVYPQNIHCVAKIDKHNEHAIYHFMQTIPLGTIAPKYYGLWECHDYPNVPKKDKENRMQIDGNFNYIIMEDLMQGFKSPNFVDIKLGTRTSDIRTKQRSVDRLAFLVTSTTSADFGFRITDILNSSTKKDKKSQQKRKEIASDIFQTSNFFKTFFSTYKLKCIYDELKRFRDVINVTLHQFPGFRIYASSIFITYDSEAPEESEVRVRLIDFAHTHFDADKDEGDRNSIQYDDGVLRGLDSLILLVGLILRERKIPLGNENLVDPEEAREKELKKAKKSEKSKKDKEKDTKKDKDDNKTKDKNNKIKKESSSEKIESNKTQKEEQKKTLDPKNSNIKQQENKPKTDHETTEDAKPEITEPDITEIDVLSGIDEEEEEEADDDDIVPLDSDSFNDRLPDSESQE